MKEQDVMEFVFSSFGRFAFDRAKEICEKEKDAIKNPQGFALSWNLFLTSLSQLAIAEKGYTSLIFLSQTPNNPKAFRKKEIPLHSQYDQIKQDLDKRVELFHHDTANEPSINTVFLGHLSDQLGFFTSARLDIIEIYQQLHEIGLNKLGSFELLIPKVDLVIATYGEKFHHPMLAALETNFTYEIEILKHLLEAQLNISRWDFTSSIIHLHQAHRRITLWSLLLSQLPEPVIPGLKLSPQKNTALPALYTWFQRYHATLLAKFSLYFFDVLNKQTSNDDFKRQLSRTTPDYYQKVVTFQRKSDAHSVCLVMDTNGMQFSGAGYVLPGCTIEALSGLDSYPAVFCYPSERPSKHWPSIVMILIEDARKLSEPDAIVTVYDKTHERTYFASQIEPHFYLTIVFESKKHEKDSTVNQFLLEIVSQLRCSKMLESLKPG